VFAAARELLTKLASSERVCILIEDLHWADPDSLSLIIELLRPPSPPGVMLLATMRTSAGHEQLRELKDALGAGLRVIEVTSLPPEDALSLAEHFVGTVAARAIIEETGGHPLFIDALARSGIAPGDAEKGGTTLDDALWDRAEATSPAAREVLALLALTPVALSQSVIATATGMTLEASVYATAELRAQRLIRMDEGGAQPYHDLVRRAVVAHIPPEANAARHAALAQALEGTLAEQPETLAIHWMEAGQRVRALGPALVAAEQATRALAFDRAARLHALVLELLPAGDSRRRDVHLAHGKALTNAGRGAEAARAFLAAAALSSDGVIELRRVAAELYLTSGHIDQGLALLETVLEPLGIRVSRTPLGALGSLLVRRAQIRLGGIDLSRLRDVIPQEDATRIDACWSAAAGLGLVDTIQGAEFQARHLLLALRAGDRYRAARAIATEACYVSTGGIRASARTARLLDLAAELALQVGDARAIGIVAGARGVAAAQLGRWREARDASENGEAILRERCQGVAWELNTARLFRLVSMVYLGEMANVVALMPAALRESEERGDLNGMIGLQTGRTNLAWLVRDDPDEAERQLDDGLRRWSRRGYQLPHYQAWAARVDVLLYRGRGRDAYTLVEREKAKLRRSLFLRVHLIRGIVGYVEGRAALAAARAERGSARTELLNVAAEVAKKLEKEGAPWTSGLAKFLSAQGLAARGQREGALDAFREARHVLAATEMHLDAAVARRAYGLLLGGAAGAVEVREAEAWMARERVLRPEAMCAVLAPFNAVD
jgi:tetratricopeptide (TPR) repeat protein